jgi:uncharacterized membrane protein YhaH (DUF805 family)
MPLPNIPAPPAPQAPELTIRKLLFSFDGRIGNWAYLVGVLLPIAALFVGGLIVTIVYFAFQDLFGPIPRGSGLDAFLGVVGVGLLIVGMIVWFWTKLAVAVKRCHDMNVTGAILLVCLIPYVGFLVFLWLLFGPGSAGANRWGDTMRTSGNT